MKLTPEEMKHVEALILRSDVGVLAKGAVELSDQHKSISYAGLIARRRARLSKARG